MLWKPINFQGVVVIDSELIDQLVSYLDEKRNRLAHDIVAIFEDGSSNIPKDLNLPQAIETIKAQIQFRLKEEEKTHAHLRLNSIKDRLNHASWDYVEVLEGCVVEFLQQIDNVRLDQMTQDTIKAIGNLKNILTRRIEEALESIRQLEEELREYNHAAPREQRSILEKMTHVLGWRVRVLDRMLLENLHKSLQFLEARERELREHYQGYQLLAARATDSMRKFDGYHVLSRISADTQYKYREVYRLLKMWEANQKTKVMSEQELTKVLRSVAPVEQVTEVFKEYHSGLKQTLYSMSRDLKSEASQSTAEVVAVKTHLRQRLNLYSLELQSMGSTIGRYREFLLRTDPNPYVRSRWGFSDWVVGPEPRQSKELMRVGYEVESLNALSTNFRQALSKQDEVVKNSQALPFYYEIHAVLHEMGQPLASRGMMRKRADSLVTYLQELDEFGSPSAVIVESMSEILSKALRADWKYHVLHEIPAFHQLYAIHMGLVGEVEDPEHLMFVMKLRKMIQQAKEWTKTNEMGLHVKQIEQELMDLKGDLQEFLAGLDGGVLSQEKVALRQRELLEYRYLFGSFCHYYCQQQGDHVRSDFLYIDQYFEYIENKLSL